MPVLVGWGKYTPLKEGAVTLSHIFSTKKTKVLTFYNLCDIVGEGGSRNAGRGQGSGGEVCCYRLVYFNRGYAYVVCGFLYFDIWDNIFERCEFGVEV